ncbi:hypothetical protein CRUP_003312 [Coryphaenoides rupestris]|nr:hypothetical protein CRUP_003312 [Coryphaenoides rupestris]
MGLPSVFHSMVEAWKTLARYRSFLPEMLDRSALALSTASVRPSSPSDTATARSVVLASQTSSCFRVSSASSLSRGSTWKGMRKTTDDFLKPSLKVTLLGPYSRLWIFHVTLRAFGSLTSLSSSARPACSCSSFTLSAFRRVFTWEAVDALPPRTTRPRAEATTTGEMRMFSTSFSLATFWYRLKPRLALLSASREPWVLRTLSGEAEVAAEAAWASRTTAAATRLFTRIALPPGRCVARKRSSKQKKKKAYRRSSGICGPRQGEERKCMGAEQRSCSPPSSRAHPCNNNAKKQQQQQQQQQRQQQSEKDGAPG